MSSSHRALRLSTSGSSFLRQARRVARGIKDTSTNVFFMFFRRFRTWEHLANPILLGLQCSAYLFCREAVRVLKKTPPNVVIHPSRISVDLSWVEISKMEARIGQDRPGCHSSRYIRYVIVALWRASYMLC